MEIRLAERGDGTAMGAVLSAAFADSATFRWIFPDERRRPDLLRALFTGTIRHVHPPGRGTLVAVVEGRIVGVAAWVPPPRWQPPGWRGLLLMPGLVRAGDRRSLRVFADRGRAVDEALRRVHAAGPHWYLAALGVAPAAQGSGAGSALVRAGLARADSDGVGSYLECEEHLVDYYAAFGFGVRHECPMPAGAARQWGMWRAGTATAPGRPA